MPFPAKLGMLLLSTLSLSAQPVISARAGYINFSQGNVQLDSDRVSPRAAPRQMQPGQTISTGRGRVEVLLAPGIIMRLGDESSARITDTRLEDTKVILTKGSAFVEVLELEKDARLRIFMGDTETEFKRNGLYRFDSSPARLRVYGGEAITLLRRAQILAKRGQAVDLTAWELSEFEPVPGDPLHSWAAQRSFTLYNSSADARRKQKHWEYVGDGWVWSQYYRTKYRSAQARRENSWGEQQLRRPPTIPRADSER